jgi:predicted permease
MKFVYSFATIFMGLALGYAFKRLVKQGTLRIGEERAEAFRSVLQKSVLLVFSPLVFCGAVWSLDLSDPRMFTFPIVGLFALVLGSLSGFVGSKILALPLEQAGVYVTCSSFTNIGAIGGLILYLLAGEQAFALLPIYKLFEDLWYYGVLFPLARSYGERAHPSTMTAPRPGPFAGVLRVLRDPFFLVATVGIALGIGLNLAGIRRPPLYGTAISFLLPASTFMLLFTIGMRVRFKVVRAHWKAASMILFSKMLLVPSAALAFSVLLGLGGMEGGIGLTVVLVLASMPVGFLGMIPPTLYRLDLSFANSLWLVSNAALVIIVPTLSFLIDKFT